MDFVSRETFIYLTIILKMFHVKHENKKVHAKSLFHVEHFITKVFS